MFNKFQDRGAMLQWEIKIRTQQGWLTDSSGGTLYGSLVSVLTTGLSKVCSMFLLCICIHVILVSSTAYPFPECFSVQGC